MPITKNIYTSDFNLDNPAICQDHVFEIHFCSLHPLGPLSFVFSRSIAQIGNEVPCGNSRRTMAVRGYAKLTYITTSGPLSISK